MSQKLQNFVKFQKFQLDDLVDFEKCCKTHIYLQKSVPIQPKTSNILQKICQKLATTLRVAGDAGGRRKVDEGHRGVRWLRTAVDFCLEGSVSAFSRPMVASRFSCCSILRALQDLHPFAPLQSQNFRKKSV